MKINLNNRVAVLAALFIGFISFAQETDFKTLKNDFEVFKNYSNFGLNLSARLQFKSQSNNLMGEDPFVHKNSFAGGIGLNYIIRPEKTWSYRIGAHYNLINETSFKFKRDQGEISFKSSSYVVSIPIEVEYKKTISKNLIWSTKTGVNITFMDRLDSTNIGVEELTLVYQPQSDLIYPNFIFSTGTYFIFKPFLLQTNFIFQKNIPSLLKGQYSIETPGNSVQRNGSYKTPGDYMGVEFIVFPKNNKKANL